MKNDWLMELKTGDKVIVSGGSMSTPADVDTVERMTETQLVLTGGGRFLRSSGIVLGGSPYCPRYLIEATPERVAKIMEDKERRRLTSYISDRLRGGLDLDVLRRVYGGLKEKYSPPYAETKAKDEVLR